MCVTRAVTKTVRAHRDLDITVATESSTALAQDADALNVSQTVEGQRVVSTADARVIGYGLSLVRVLTSTNKSLLRRYVRWFRSCPNG